MTNRNTNLKTEPFFLEPAGKDYLWGGSRIKDDFDKKIELETIAESWECSTHEDGLSYISSGIYKGKSLKEVLNDHPDFLGEHLSFLKDLPILIKLIDAKHDLSVQVHPDDEYARVNENGQRGKSEMWYVMDANKESTLVYGLKKNATKDEIRKALEEKRIDEYLLKIPVHKNDVFVVNPGTIHAIGSGCLIAEIQENSNLTYRLYDYDRVDKKGNRRELHIDKALDVADLKASNSPRQPMRVLKYSQGCAREMLSRCKYYEVYRMIVNTERTRKLVDYHNDEIAYRVLFCIKGCGMIYTEENSYPVFKGDCIFLPAGCQDMKIHGRMEFLEIRG